MTAFLILDVPKRRRRAPKWNADNTVYVVDPIYGKGWIARAKNRHGRWREVRYLGVYPFHTRERALEALARGRKSEIIGSSKWSRCKCGTRTNRYCRACWAPVCGGSMSDCQLAHRIPQRENRLCPQGPMPPMAMGL